MDSSRRKFLKEAAAAAAFPALLSGRSERPNILWIMSDEQRPDSLGCYGSGWAHSPTLDRLAGEGVLFENAYTPSPVCVPARCSLLTGDFGSSIGVLHNQEELSEDPRFLTWEAERAGYRTASFGKKHYSYPGSRQAFQTEAGRAVGGVVDAQGYPARHPQDEYGVVQYPNVPRKLQGPRRTWILAGEFPESKEKTAEAENIRLAMEWLARHDRAEPFLLRLSLNAPHTPVVVPPSFLDSIDPDAIEIPMPGEDVFSGKPRYEAKLLKDFQGAHVFSQDQIRTARHFYYARAAYLDYEIGRFIRWMDERGLLDNTIVAFVSDHGAHLGDHGLFQKLTFYEQVVTVPYLFWWRNLPASRKGARIQQPVHIHTLLPAALEMADVKSSRAAEAGSLAAALQGEPLPERPVFSELKFGYLGYRDDDRLVMIRDGRYKLSLFQNPHDPDQYAGREEGSLYDLKADPREGRNLYGDAAHEETVKRLRRQITNWDRGRFKEA